jgi:hypothetical protein
MSAIAAATLAGGETLMFSSLVGGHLEFLSSGQYMQNMKSTPRTPTKFEVRAAPRIGGRAEPDDDVPAGIGRTVGRGKQMTKVKTTTDDTDRPTEDDVAREHLGGSRGAAELDPAPMTRQRRIKTPPNDTEPGHTA